jgi:CO/xanthine dehydrogenase Mo-binding subunit/aerobic-type carbon monoxide dehydrogenase small subunit (CoxS/CutS family)
MSTTAGVGDGAVSAGQPGSGASRQRIRLGFTVNGIERDLLVDASATLLAVLRDELEMTGTKSACGVGECGACTVLVDGLPVLSCSTLAASVQGKRVQTIEGMAKRHLLHPIQQAFIECGAIQCGFCTPGMIMAAKALLDENPDPSREQIRRHMAGNLCRCTGYVKIVDAVLAAADKIRRGDAGTDARDSGSEAFTGEVVGRRITQPEAVAKATGSARYVSDVKLPGMLHAKLLRSPYPHARVKRIDTSAAEQLPGVEAILTPEDVLDWQGFDRGLKDLPMIAGGYTVPPDERVLNARARHVGDAVAAVAATSVEIAEQALELLEVEYEPLPFVLEPQQALAEGAPQISDYAPGNIGKHLEYLYPEGDADAALERAACVVEGEFETPKQEACTEETAACVASIDPNGRLTVWSQCQLAHMARRELAHIFNIPVRKVRLITPVVGGSFGQRGALCADAYCVALALHTGQPVKLVFTREENFIGLETRTGFSYRFALGFDADGSLSAAKTEMLGKLGGYMGCGPMAAGIAMIMGLGHYRVPNRRGEADMVMTNTPLSGAMRGFGNPAIMWGIEQLMDEAAGALGLDPIDIRLKNIKRVGETANMGLPIESIYLKECVQRGAAAFGWTDKRARRKAPGPIKRGVGMATMSHCSGAAPLYIDHSNAVVKLNEDGSADLVVHPAQVGQHIWGALAQIAAAELGLAPEDVKIVTGDTDVTLFEYGSDASRSTYAIGNAALGAARNAKNAMLAHASRMLDHPREDLAVDNRWIFARSDANKRLRVAEVCSDGIYNFKGHARHFVGQCSWESKFNSPPTGAYFAEVEVDTRTGVVEVVHFVTAIDCGKAINPMAVEGQIEGAIQQGIGYCLTENYIIDPASGRVETDNYDRYKMPGFLDMPQIEVVIVDELDPKGPHGAKGVGEAGMVGVAPAIGNAIYDAIGIRFHRLPITAESVLAALRRGGESKRSS